MTFEIRQGPAGTPALVRWCVGPCGRLLSVVAFRRGIVCGRCRDVTAHARARGEAAFTRHLALPPADRVGHRRVGRAA